LSDLTLIRFPFRVDPNHDCVSAYTALHVKLLCVSHIDELLLIYIYIYIYIYTYYFKKNYQFIKAVGGVSHSYKTAHTFFKSNSVA